MGDSSAVPGGGDHGGTAVDATTVDAMGTSESGTLADAGTSVEGSVDAGHDAPNDSMVGARPDGGNTGPDAPIGTGPGTVNDATVQGNDATTQGGDDAGADATLDVRAEQGADANADVALEAGADVTTETRADAAIDSGSDAENDVATDAAADATDAASTRPDAGDAGSVQDQCNAFVAANKAMFLPADNLVCTQTELDLFEKTVTGQSLGACLACAFNLGCLDDTFAPTDINRECEDLAAAGGTTAVQECYATLQCDLGEQADGTVGPAPSAGIVSNSYCGMGATTAMCTAAPPGGPMGACVAQIAAGFPSSFTPTQILENFAAPAFPSGIANQIVSCLLANCKDTAGNNACFP